MNPSCNSVRAYSQPESEMQTNLDEASGGRLVVRSLHVIERKDEQSELLCVLLKIPDLQSRLDTAFRETFSHGPSAIEREHDTFTASDGVRCHCE